MIKTLQKTVHLKDPTDWCIQAVSTENKAFVLCDIKFRQHPVLNEALMDAITDRVFDEICKAIPHYNEDQRQPTEAEERRAEAKTRQIIRNLGMRPIP